MNKDLFKSINPQHTIGLIFDVDELLFDNREEIRSAYRALVEARSIMLQRDESFSGKNLFDIISNIKLKYNLSESVDELVRERRAVYIEKLKNSKSSPRAGVKELFEFIENNRPSLNIRIAYATSSEKAFNEIVMKKIFNDIGMYKYALDPDSFFFQNNGEPASTCWENGLVKKPDPMLYKITMAKMKLPPSQCIAFEDSLSGYKAAHTAGLNIVVIPGQRNYKHFIDIEYKVLYEDRFCKLASLKDFMPFLKTLLREQIKGGISWQ